jgi:hypothetical protein
LNMAVSSTRSSSVSKNGARGSSCLFIMRYRGLS